MRQMQHEQAGRPKLAQNLSRVVERHPEHQTPRHRELFPISDRISWRARCHTIVSCSACKLMEM